MGWSSAWMSVIAIAPVSGMVLLIGSPGGRQAGGAIPGAKGSNAEASTATLLLAACVSHGGLCTDAV